MRSSPSRRSGRRTGARRSACASCSIRTALADHELGELLRRRGVHREQLDAWRAAAEGFGQPATARRSPESKRIRELEREVARKDKALAETAALLVLQKKLQLLFPAGQAAEDDDTDDGSER